MAVSPPPVWHIKAPQTRQVDPKTAAIEQCWTLRTRLSATIPYINNRLVLQKATAVYNTLLSIPLDELEIREIQYINRTLDITRQLLVSQPGSERIRLLEAYHELIMLAPGSPNQNWNRMCRIYSMANLALAAVVSGLIIATILSSGTVPLGLLGLEGMYLAAAGLGLFAQRQTGLSKTMQDLDNSIHSENNYALTFN